MLQSMSHFQLLYDEKKRLIGVFLSPQLWESAQRELAPTLERALSKLDPEHAPAPPPEPMKDWDALNATWDFKYPLKPDVECLSCGTSTTDWRADEPRRFRLIGANLGGLATFKCQSCGAKVVKKHFKDHIAVECLTNEGPPQRKKVQMLPPKK